MIEGIDLKFTENKEPINLSSSSVTILVGPNNSGKSLCLKEIEQVVSGKIEIEKCKIVKNLRVSWPTIEQADAMMQELRQEPQNFNIPGHVNIGRYSTDGNDDHQMVDPNAVHMYINSKFHIEQLCRILLKYYVIRLDGRTRFQLTDDRAGGDLLAKPKNLLSHLFIDENIRAQLRAMVFEAFKKYLVIDPTNLGILRVRVSDVPLISDEQSLSQEAREFHANAMHIKDASDGVQAYVGVLAAVVTGDYKIICIDEPEAFLHPPLARQLGQQLASIAKTRNAQLFASTHSADFLLGCLQVSKDVQVIRLEYSEGKSRGRFIESAVLKEVFRSPLLRSANVVSGLFYDGVVVTESDNDRAFYSEVYNRISEVEKLPSVLFVNAQNKQTIKNIIEPLRSFGIPAAAIVDLDIIRDGGKVWSDWLKAARLPKAMHEGYANQRISLDKAFIDNKLDMKKFGIYSLSDEDKEAAILLLDVLGQHGLFVVDRGELENWLPHLQAIGKKTDWTISALEKMGSNPDDEFYVKPSSDDVWKFMRNLTAWIANPNRKGSG